MNFGQYKRTAGIQSRETTYRPMEDKEGRSSQKSWQQQDVSRNPSIYVDCYQCALWGLCHRQGNTLHAQATIRGRS